MGNYCTRCGARLTGPFCGNCNQADITMPLGAPVATAGSRRPWYRSTAALVIASSTLVLLVAAGTTLLLVRPFAPAPKPVAAAAPRTSTPAAPPSTVVVPQPQPSTVTVPAPPVQLPATGNADSGVSGDSAPYADAIVEYCGVDATGSHLTAAVFVTSETDHAVDVIGTVTFTDAVDGTRLGTGGFSAASLPAYGSIDTYVDTSDPGDDRAAESADAIAASGGAVACEVSDLHYR